MAPSIGVIDAQARRFPTDKQYSLEHKVLIMQLLSRVMGAHKLCVLGFYSYIIKLVLGLVSFQHLKQPAHLISSHPPPQVPHLPPTPSDADPRCPSSIGPRPHPSRRPHACHSQASSRVCPPRSRSRGHRGRSQLYPRGIPSPTLVYGRRGGSAW
jgi:hypothetical protein